MSACGRGISNPPLPCPPPARSFDNGAGFVYNLTWLSNLPLMRRLQSNEDGRGISVLVYNGETDPSISSVKSQNWTFSLGFPLKEAWRPWTFGRDANSSQIVAGQVGERRSVLRERLRPS